MDEPREIVVAKEELEARTIPTPADSVIGYEGWPKILTQFGLIGVITILMVWLVYGVRQDARDERRSAVAERTAFIQEAHTAHQEMQKLTNAIEHQTRAIWILIDEVRRGRPPLADKGPPNNEGKP